MANSASGFVLAVFAAVMLAGGSAATLPMRAPLCGGGSAEIPGKAPATGCDLACHAGCQRRRRS